MDKKLLLDLKKEYELKRLKAIERAEQKKIEIYSKYPKLQEIENSLSRLSIETAKSILLHNSSQSAINSLKK